MLIYILLLLTIGVDKGLILSFIFIVIHELVHFIAARILGFVGYEIEINIYGANLHLKDIDEASPLEDIIISLAGPLTNFVLAVFFYILFNYFNTEILFLIYKCNLVLCLFNLIPAIPLDGGRILRAILSLKIIYKKANEIVVKCSYVLGNLLMIIFIWGFLHNIYNISIGIAAVVIIINTHQAKGMIAYLVMGDIIKKKDKFLKRGYLENKSISIHFKTHLIDILGIVDKNKYTLFIVLDDNMKMIDMICEGEILEALKESGNITLEEYYNSKE